MGLSRASVGCGPWPPSDSILGKDMSNFKVGDVVKRKDGMPFSDGNLYNTIRKRWPDETFPSANIVWVKYGFISVVHIEPTTTDNH